MRVLILAAALLAHTAVIAQTPAPAGAPPAAPAGAPAAGAGEARAKLIAADANKDGKWDKAEWLAAGRRDRGFDFMDADSDGFVTQAELKDGMAKMQARRAAATPAIN
jgi:EF hand